MRSTADDIVVGGGVVGASIASHLSQLDVGNVVLLESGELSCGDTCRSGALVRTPYTNALKPRLSVASLPWLDDSVDRARGECGFNRTVSAQLVTVSDGGPLRANVSMLAGVAVETRVMDAAELESLKSELAPAPGDVDPFEPRSGCADPGATTHTLAVADIRGGAESLDHATVLWLRASGDRTTGVQTSSGSVQAETIGLANGCWSSPLVEPFGPHLPIDAVAAEVAFVSRPDSLLGSVGHLTVIDCGSVIYARPNGVAETLVRISQAARTTESSDDVQVSSSIPGTAREQLHLSTPASADQGVLRAHVKRLDVTPDRAELIEKVDGNDRTAIAVGMGGSGFKNSPAIGACVAEPVVEGRSRTAPIDEFAPARIAEGRGIMSNEYALGSTVRGTSPVFVH